MDEIELNIKTYQYNAFPDFIMQKHPDYLEWLYSSFIQVIGLDIALGCVDYNCGSVYGRLPLLSINDYSSRIDKMNIGEIRKIVEKGLKSGKKYYCFLDSYWIEGRSEYKKEHYPHDVLISEDGLDDFLFLENVAGFYKFFRINKDSFLRNMLSISFKTLIELDVNYSKSYELDIKNICTMLDEYLNSYSNSNNIKLYYDDTDFFCRVIFDNKEKVTICYGIEVYNLIKQKILGMAQKSERIDFRAIYLLLEKNELMVKRIAYLGEKLNLDKHVIEELKSKVNAICIRLKKCLYIVIKYNYKRDSRKVIDMCEELSEIMNFERTVYEAILRTLQKRQ